MIRKLQKNLRRDLSYVSTHALKSTPSFLNRRSSAENTVNRGCGEEKSAKIRTKHNQNLGKKKDIGIVNKYYATLLGLDYGKFSNHYFQDEDSYSTNNITIQQVIQVKKLLGTLLVISPKIKI